MDDSQYEKWKSQVSVGQLKPYFEDIVRRLFSDSESSRISLFVGAGFSRNAKPKGVGLKGFPLWDDLKQPILEGLSGANEKDDVDSLASEFVARYNQGKLDGLLEQFIPDKDFEPSDLHESYLRLPWTDVFTTNYDTLLERAAESTYNRRYSPVYTAEDIAKSPAPRIIKLHGTLWRPERCVLTEEHFRQYPEDNSVFVNTMQQALLENALLLIGFSGTDPNFRKWLGWVRDRIPEHMNPIYLIGVFDMPPSKIRELENLGVTIIDLVAIGCAKDDYEDSLRFAIRYLEELRPRAFEDVVSSALEKISRGEDQRLKQYVHAFRTMRNDYPGWLITPQKITDKLCKDALRAYQSLLREIQTADDEVNRFNKDNLTDTHSVFWALELCYLPMYLNDLQLFEDAVVRWANLDLDCEQKRYWSFIVGVLLRGLRIGHEWERHAQLIEKLKELETWDNQNKHINLSEAVRIRLCKFDIKGAIDLLDNWSVEGALPEWKLRKAALLVECGKAQEAEQLSLNVLQAVRHELRTKSRDRYLLSLEGCGVYLSYILRDSMTFEPSDEVGVGRRLEELAKHDCDPRSLLGSLHSELEKGAPEEKAMRGYQPDFLGHSTTTSVTLGENIDALRIRFAFQTISVFEEGGIPVKAIGQFHASVFRDAQELALKWIYGRNACVLLRSMLRIAGKKSLPFLTRTYLDSLNRGSALSLWEDLDSQAVRILTGLAHGRTGSTETMQLRVWLYLCGHSERGWNSLIDVLKDALRISNLRAEFNDMVHEILKIAAFFDSTALVKFVEENCEEISIPIPAAGREFLVEGWPDPLTLLFHSGAVEGGPLNLSQTLIVETLFLFRSKAFEIRMAAFRRLKVFNQRGALSQEQQEEFGSILWSSLNPVRELPEIAEAGADILLHVPAPDTVDVVERLRTYFSKFAFREEFPRNSEGKIVQFAFTGDPDDSVAREFLRASAGGDQVTGCIEWAEEEANEFGDRICNSWEIEKEDLTQDITPFVDVPATIRSVYGRRAEVLAKVLLPRMSTDRVERGVSVLLDMLGAGVGIAHFLPQTLSCSVDDDLKEAIAASLERYVAEKAGETAKLSDRSAVSASLAVVEWWRMGFRDASIPQLPDGLLAYPLIKGVLIGGRDVAYFCSALVGILEEEELSATLLKDYGRDIENMLIAILKRVTTPSVAPAETDASGVGDVAYEEKLEGGRLAMAIRKLYIQRSQEDVPIICDEWLHVLHQSCWAEMRALAA